MIIQNAIPHNVFYVCRFLSKINNTRYIVPQLVTLFAIFLLSMSLCENQRVIYGQMNNTANTIDTLSNDPLTLNQKGYELYSLGNYNEAIKYFEKSLEVDPDNEYASTMRSVSLALVGSSNNAGNVSSNNNVTSLSNGDIDNPQYTSQQQQQPVQQQQQPVQSLEDPSLLLTQSPQPEQPPQQQPQINQQHEEVDSFIASGEINTAILTNSTTWDARGDWNMVVEEGEIETFATNMTWVSGQTGHTHEFVDFTSDEEIELPPDNLVSIEGKMGVGTNGDISWEDVPATINIGAGGRTMSISLDHEETDHHFSGQHITGTVTLLTPCSSTPGADMVVYPSCG